MWWFPIMLLATAAARAFAAEEYVLQFTSENFKRSTRDNLGCFVMFYAPWCSHCTIFYPIWNQLAEMVNSPESKFAIARVDCTAESNLCRESEITGYPTLLYFKQNSLQPSEYRGTRDLPSLTLFLNEAMAASNQESLTEKSVDEVNIFSGMAYLTDQNFEKFVAKGQHFIMFYAPWCRVSQTLAPVWSLLAEEYATNDSVHIGKLDCMEHRASCLNFDIKDYPHLIWFLNGKVMEAITGPQSVEGLREFVDQMALPENHNPERFIKKKEGLPIARISEDTFDLYMGHSLVFINYYATWCAHCKLMIPTWLELARTFQHDPRIIIADVDCGQYHSLCSQEQVHHFPTLVLYKKSEVIYDHRGSTTLEDLVQEVQKHVEDLVSDAKNHLVDSNIDVSVEVKDEL